MDLHKAHAVQESFPYAGEFCRLHNLPMRNQGIIIKGVKSTPTKAFFGSVDNFSKIKEWINTFEEGNYYEIMFHPGSYAPECKSSLNSERARDVKNIKKLNLILKENNIKLVNYFALKTS